MDMPPFLRIFYVTQYQFKKCKVEDGGIADDVKIIDETFVIGYSATRKFTATC